MAPRNDANDMVYLTGHEDVGQPMRHVSEIVLSRGELA